MYVLLSGVFEAARLRLVPTVLCTATTHTRSLNRSRASSRGACSTYVRTVKGGRPRCWKKEEREREASSGVTCSVVVREIKCENSLFSFFRCFWGHGTAAKSSSTITLYQYVLYVRARRALPVPYHTVLPYVYGIKQGPGLRSSPRRTPRWPL